jgi:hypothetical protein
VKGALSLWGVQVGIPGHGTDQTQPPGRKSTTNLFKTFS